MRWLAVALFVVVTLASVASACTDQTGSDSAPYGCCEVGTTPPAQCTMKYGGPKRTPADDCITGSDGMLPDTTEPGWTQVSDGSGCKRWIPPPNGKKVCCGCAPPVIVDASTDAPDGADADASDASDSSTDASTDDAATDAADASTD